MSHEKLKIKNGRAARRCFLIFNFAFLIFSTALAANVDWSNGAGNNNWNTGGNWTGGLLPGSADAARINLAGANRAVFGFASTNIGALSVGNSANGELLVTNGTLNCLTVGVRAAFGSFNGSTGIVTITGGTFISGGYVEAGLNAGARGVINIAGGLFDVSRNATVAGIPSVSLALGDGSGAQGTCVLSGGELRTRTGIVLGVNSGAGRFEVRGAGVANIGTDGSADDGFWMQSSNSVLAAYVTNGALGSILVDNLASVPGTYSHGNVIFMPGSKLELGFLGATNLGSWDLMKWDGALLTNGLSLVSGTDTNWSFAFVDTDGVNGYDTLRIIYGPPPPPTGLLAIPGDQQVKLFWSASSTATSYKIRGGTNSGGPYLFTNTTTSSSYTNTGLINGTTYYYVVTTLIGGNESGFSSEASATPFHSNFIHPGGMHTQADLDRMKAKVAANAHPWIDGWAMLTNNSHSQLNYAANPQPIIYRGFDGVHPENYATLFNDIAAAYQLALRYQISGDTNYANAAIQIMNGWSATLTNISGTSDQFLASGIYGYEFANAGELMRNYAGWAPVDFLRFQNLMRNVFYPMNHDFLVRHNGACLGHYWANWDLCNMASIASIGVLCDDQAKFDEAVNYFKNGLGNGSIGNAVYYMHPGHLGQWQESGRDQGHNTLGVALMGPLCEVAWNQGVDLYGYAGNRFLAGCEYIAKYNLTNTVPYVTYNNCDEVNQISISSDGQGTIRACWEMVYNHYVNRMGLSAPYTTQFASLVRPEGGGGDYGPNSGGFDQLGFGTLTYTRDFSGAVPSATPPIPVGLAATAPTCGQINLKWNSVAGATSYNVMRSTVSGGPFTAVVALNVGTTNYVDTSVLGVATYYYVISAANGGGESDFSNQAGATSSVCPLSGGWTTQDVGAPATTGGANLNGNTFTLQGAGLDISGTADSFRFVYRSLTNSGEIIARWAFLYPGGSEDKVGLMMRETTNSNSKTAVLFYDENSSFNRLRLPRRSNTGGTMSYPGPDGPTGTDAPLWLRLARTNDIFTGYYSADGTNWTLVTTATNAFTPATILVGMETCSRNPNWLGTATFDNVSVSGLWPASPGTPRPLVAVAGDAQAVLSWGSALNATGYNLKRGNSGSGPFALVATNFSGLAFTNTGLANGGIYYYVVSGTNNFGESADSAAVSVRPVSQTPPQLGFGFVANQMQFHWPTSNVGWKLQVQTNSLNAGLGANWSTIAVSSGTNQIFMPVVTTNGSVFFRLIYP